MRRLELREESWKNVFEVIRDSEINAKGNFWASIQYLEEQLEDLQKTQNELSNRELTKDGKWIGGR